MGSVDCFATQASAICTLHSVVSPLDAQIPIPSPRFGELPNSIPLTTTLALGYHQFSSLFVGPAPQFGIIEQGPILSRPSNCMCSNGSFTFMPVLPLCASSAFVGATSASSNLGVGMPYQCLFPAQGFSNGEVQTSSFALSREIPAPTPPPTENFNCRICGREFFSWAALGGHVSGHKRRKARKAKAALRQNMGGSNQANIADRELSFIAGTIFESMRAAKEEKNVAPKLHELANEGIVTSAEDGSWNFLALLEHKSK